MKTYIGDRVYLRPITPSEATPEAPNPCAYIVGFERPEGDCEGVVSIWQSPDDAKYSRPVWTVEQAEPLTLTPSVQCPRHPEEHGFIRDGRWVAA